MKPVFNPAWRVQAVTMIDVELVDDAGVVTRVSWTNLAMEAEGMMPLPVGGAPSAEQEPWHRLLVAARAMCKPVVYKRQKRR